MVITDPIADMLTRIRNAYTAKHDEVSVPASTIKKAIAEILLDEGYIKGYEIKEEGPKKTINIALKYGPNRQRVITGLKRISKPGLRVYARKDNVPKVLNGMGIAILSTSHGVMTDREARKQGVGGESSAISGNYQTNTLPQPTLRKDMTLLKIIWRCNKCHESENFRSTFLAE